MSLAERHVDSPVGSFPTIFPALPVPAWHNGPRRALWVDVARLHRFLDSILLVAGVLALLFALVLFLYTADPLLHHDITTLWQMLGAA
jgi:hypothetical protein